MGGIWIHRLSKRDLTNKTAQCSNCGLVRIIIKNGVAKCLISYQASKQGTIGTLPPRSIRCEICGLVKKLYNDHDHKTRKHRGWICNNCNLLIGLAKDDVKLLKNAIEYLLG